MKCPKCSAELQDMNGVPVDPSTFVTHRGFFCDSCKWRGWVGISIEELEDKVYNDTHIQMGLNRLWELRQVEPLRNVFGSRLSYLLGPLDRIAGEL